jgi:hypothetical protein
MVADEVYQGALNVLASADKLHLCRQACASRADVDAYSLGRATPRFSLGQTDLLVLPVKEGEVVAPGEATHWALTAGPVLLASAPLSKPVSIRPGLVFSVASFTIRFP